MATPEERQKLCANLTLGYVDPDWPNPYGPSDACYIPYGYVPSFGLCIAAMALFTIAFVLHGYLVIRYRTWYFLVILVGPVLEVAGYFPRILSAKLDPYSSTFFVLQYFFIIVAPLSFSAAIYGIASVLIRRIGREYSPLPPWLVVCIFIAFDIGATTLQIFQTSSVALIGVPSSSHRPSGGSSRFLTLGLAIQMVSFGLFILYLAWFSIKSRRVTPPAFKKFVVATFVAALFLWLRTCFRLIETVQGFSSAISTHEAFFGCLEFAPVVSAVFILAYWHPGRCLPKGGLY